MPDERIPEQARNARRLRAAAWAPRRVAGVPLVFVVTSLIAILLIPLVIQQRAQPLRGEIANVAEPARNLTDEVKTRLARETSALRGYALTGREDYLARYQRHRAEEQAQMQRLEPLARRLGPQTYARYRQLRDRMGEWHARIESEPFVPAPPRGAAELAEVPFEEALYLDALDGTDALEAAIDARVAELQDRIAAIDRLNSIVTTVLAVIAIAAAVLVGWIGRRLRQLADDLETAAREAERSAIEADRRRRQLQHVLDSRARLLRGVSHDLKNPISVVDGYAQLLESEPAALGPRQREWIARIRRSTYSMLALLNDLLDLSRVEAGELRVSRSATELEPVLRETAEDHRGEADAAGLDYEIALPPELPPAMTDPERVRQILGNLLSNAVKYTPQGGRVTISGGVRAGPSAPGSGEWLCIDVTDTGPGIRPDEQARIFDEFYRVDDATRSGAGIGLTISRRIARLLGGEISVDSEPGRGSTFTLWLPLAGGASERSRPAA